MIKILNVLCLIVIFSFFNTASASDLSSDDQKKLIRLQSQATEYFDEGRYESERLIRLKILKVHPTFLTLQQALQSCVVMRKFEAGERLLRKYGAYVGQPQARELRDYLQDEKVKHEQIKFNQQFQRRRTVLGKIRLLLEKLW
ncbi:MAG: hypothetical protein J0H12_01550 [Candidatus Paracaedimonas acanthamoebae]|uniref:DUF4168 domain-containing protein n=1 Tax=Candidatus Paracaedimonas acanthamoebae TaxID=244581 RepID=A0A8J7PLF5_9PROT|nr:hypothetical protein [Candidatus Paracaedimonas acanthamoebae]